MPRNTLALAQINTRLGDVARNLEVHLAYLDEAKRLGPDVIQFPELCLTGYVLQDITPRVACEAASEDRIFKYLLEASQGIGIMAGSVEANSRMRSRIASAYHSGGEVLHVHRKVYLATYGLFDEGRFFARGDHVRAFDTRFGRVGILICEDFWHASPPYLLWLDGADTMLFCSASPGRGLNRDALLDSARWVEHINQA